MPTGASPNARFKNAVQGYNGEDCNMPPYENGHEVPNQPIVHPAQSPRDSDKGTVQGTPPFPDSPKGPVPSGPASPADPFLNKQIGNLLLQKVLGQGGFGRVYLARELNLERDVAVKFLRDTIDSHHLR